MNRRLVYPAFRNIMLFAGIAVLLVAGGVVFAHEQPKPAIPAGDGVNVYERFAGAPEKPQVGQILRNPHDNMEYIYNGRVWVPHDNRADKIDYDKVRENLRKSKEGSR